MKKALYLMITLMAALALTCGKQTDAPLTGRITFMSGDVTINGKDGAFGAAVTVGDTIATGAKSLAVVQFGETAVVNLKENTQLKIDALMAEKHGDTITIHQKIGSTFNKIARKGSKYSVHTPTSVAAVRGTNFLCSVTEKGSSIKLSTGRVKIIPVIKGEPEEAAAVVLDPGKKIDTAESGVAAPSDLSEREIRDMKAMDAIALIPNIDREETVEEIKKQPEGERPVVVPVEIINMVQSDTAEEVREKRAPITLKNILDRYGSLSVITTTEGAVYTGAFAQEGDQMKIFTTEGTVKVPASKISNVTRYKGEVK